MSKTRRSFSASVGGAPSGAAGGGLGGTYPNPTVTPSVLLVPGASRIVVVDLAFNTPNITTGLTIYTPAANDVVLWGYFFITAAFDGTTPSFEMYAGAGTTPFAQADASTEEIVTDSSFRVSASAGLSMRLWVANGIVVRLTKTYGAVDPPGSTAGTAKAVLVVGTPSAT